jgi:hypothetical protein
MRMLALILLLLPGWAWATPTPSPTMTATPTPAPSVARFNVMGIWPNPVLRDAGGAQIGLQAPEAGQLRLSLYNARGEEVRRLVKQVVKGEHFLAWDGTNQSGNKVSPGVYYLHGRWEGQGVSQQDGRWFMVKP